MEISKIKLHQLINEAYKKIVQEIFYVDPSGNTLEVPSQDPYIEIIHPKVREKVSREDIIRDTKIANTAISISAGLRNDPNEKKISGQELQEKIKLYDKKFSFKTWLISIAKNTYADQLRKKKTIIDDYENIEKYNYSRSPEEDFIEKENYDELKEKINELKPNYKEVLKYRYFEDLSIKEISKKLKQPTSTIKIKIFRAKKLLIEKIKNND